MLQFTNTGGSPAPFTPRRLLSTDRQTWERGRGIVHMTDNRDKRGPRVTRRDCRLHPASPASSQVKAERYRRSPRWEKGELGNSSSSRPRSVAQSRIDSEWETGRSCRNRGIKQWFNFIGLYSWTLFTDYLSLFVFSCVSEVALVDSEIMFSDTHTAQCIIDWLCNYYKKWLNRKHYSHNIFHEINILRSLNV